jgi:MmgE/PrpD N-terminal domain
MTITSVTGPTAILADFVSETRYERLPSSVVEAARIAILDGVANLLAGCGQPVAQITAGFVREMGGTAACSVIGHEFKTSPPQAAFANGVALHCLDFEVQGYPAAHGTSAILPPALALGEARGASGRDIITAYVVGWEVQARLRSAAPHRPAHPFHPPVRLNREHKRPGHQLRQLGFRRRLNGRVVPGQPFTPFGRRCPKSVRLIPCDRGSNRDALRRSKIGDVTERVIGAGLDCAETHNISAV